MSTTGTTVAKLGQVKAAAPVEKVDPMAGPKKLAAEAAVGTYLKSGMKLGIGTGSTMKFAIDAVGAKLASGELTKVTGVSTSERTTAQAKTLNIPLTSLDKAGQLDLAIDGADEVASVGKEFHLIKGMGGALLREKEVASKARHFVVVVDESKLVTKLGTKSPLPVEVAPAQWKAVSAALQKLGGVPTLRGGDAAPYVTDNKNYIVDVKWPKGIDNPKQLARTLDGLAGVKAHGLFLGMAEAVVVAKADGSVKTLDHAPAKRPADAFGAGAVGAGAVGGATPAPGAQKAVTDLLKGTQALQPEMRKWIQEQLLPQAAVMDGSLVMESARARLAEALSRGEAALPELDRAQLPQTEGEAIDFLMKRVGLTAKEQATVKKGLQALEKGALLPNRGEPIGGLSSKYPETFRTQMAVTDPGIDHLAMTLADPRMLNGSFVHMEIIDRPTEHTAPYSNPGAVSISKMRMLMGDDAPATVFMGRPNFMPSIKQEGIEGMDSASAGLKFNLPTAANQLSNLARGLFDKGVSEVKVTMDGLSPAEVKTLGQATYAQTQPGEGQYISAAFNLLQVIKDFELAPADAPAISGAPTPEQRALMLRGSLLSIDAAKEGGWKKVTVDSASMTPPSYPLIEFFGVENLFEWAHHAHSKGLETYGSGGMRDYHFPLLQFTGLDGVGVGFSIHEAPKPETPGNAGRMLPERVLSALSQRDAAEKSPVGRASVMLRMLDERVSEGTATAPQLQLRTEVHAFLKQMARGIDGSLDGLKATRDAANKAAGALTNADAKKQASDAARKAFEDGFKQLIGSALVDPAREATASGLLEKGKSLGVLA